MTDGDDDWGQSPAVTDSEPPPYQAFTSLRAALLDAIGDAPHLRRDRAMIALAFRYADLIDDAADRLEESDDEDEARDFARMAALVAKIGPRLEAALINLGMAPGARPATRGGDPDGRPDPGAAALRDLRERATAPAGLDPRTLVDPAVTAADAGD